MDLEDSTCDDGTVVGLKDSQTRTEQLATWHDHDVKAWRDVIPSENLSNQSFGAVPDNCTAQTLGGGNAQPPDRQPVWLAKQGVVASWYAGALRVDVLKVCVPADPLTWPKLQALVSTDS